MSAAKGSYLVPFPFAGADDVTGATFGVVLTVASATVSPAETLS